MPPSAERLEEIEVSSGYWEDVADDEEFMAHDPLLFLIRDATETVAVYQAAEAENGTRSAGFGLGCLLGRMFGSEEQSPKHAEVVVAVGGDMERDDCSGM